MYRIERERFSGIPVDLHYKTVRRRVNSRSGDYENRRNNHLHVSEIALQRIVPLPTRVRLKTINSFGPFYERLAKYIR